MKLNLGCGQNKIPGWYNVDREAAVEPDQVVDLEDHDWPWQADSVDEVMLSHVLEHLGGSPERFLHILQELYRVCCDGAMVHIIVPHPRHDHFLGDPTHVRPITLEVMSLFSRKQCEKWRAEGAANTPLALTLGVDFEIREAELVVEEAFRHHPELPTLIKTGNNIVREIRMRLQVVKGGAQ